MEFRPCIDIHNGKVKQIVGGTLNDEKVQAQENFVAEHDAAYYAEMYRNDGLKGGHIIMLNPAGTPEYEQDKAQALAALAAYPGGMQIGGGITADNAKEFLDAGASHVIVTSYVFKDGKINFDNLQKLRDAVGRERIVLDLSCRKKGNEYFVVTDRWQKFTNVKITEDRLKGFSKYCDEYLIHAVDVEGNKAGIDEDLIRLLASYEDRPITYAGGVSSMADISQLFMLTKGKLDFTIGSALDIFGGNLKYDFAIEFCRRLKMPVF